MNFSACFHCSSASCRSPMIRETTDPISFRRALPDPGPIAVDRDGNFRQVAPSKWRHGERCETKRFLPAFMAMHSLTCERASAHETSIISSRYFCHEGTRWTQLGSRAMFNTFPVDTPRVWRFCLMHNAHASSLRHGRASKLCNAPPQPPPTGIYLSRLFLRRARLGDGNGNIFLPPRAFTKF